MIPCEINPKLPDPNPRSPYNSLCPKTPKYNPARSGFARLGSVASELLAQNEDDAN